MFKLNIQKIIKNRIHRNKIEIKYLQKETKYFIKLLKNENENENKYKTIKKIKIKKKKYIGVLMVCISNNYFIII